MVEDKVTKVRLYSPSDHDFHHERPDGTSYIVEVRKGKDKYTYTPEAQLSLTLNGHLIH